MLQKLTANNELDILTHGEVRDVLKSWANELTRGARMIRGQIQANADGGGALLMGGNDDGPAEGIMWAINRFSVALPAGATLGAGGLQVFANTEQSPSALLVSKLVTDLYPGDKGCCLSPGDTLRITGTGITVGAQVTVTMSMKEVPALMAWSL